MTKRITITAIVAWVLAATCYAQTTAPECDFSAYQPLVITHLFPVIKKVPPKYPPIARAGHAEAKVLVVVLSSRQKVL
jgi:hypothetical protein